MSIELPEVWCWFVKFVSPYPPIGLFNRLLLYTKRSVKIQILGGRIWWSEEVIWFSQYRLFEVNLLNSFDSADYWYSSCLAFPFDFGCSSRCLCRSAGSAPCRFRLVVACLSRCCRCSRTSCTGNPFWLISVFAKLICQGIFCLWQTIFFKFILINKYFCWNFEFLFELI